MAANPSVFFITGNANKLREVKAILEPAVSVQSQSCDLEELQGTIEEVTEAKCRKAAELVRYAYPYKGFLQPCVSELFANAI